MRLNIDEDYLSIIAEINGHLTQERAPTVWEVDQPGLL